jgi:hypothetical protein
MNTMNILNGKWLYNPAWSLDDDTEESIWQDSEISMKAKGLFGYMRSKPSNWDFSCKRIAEEMRDSMKPIQLAMKELEEFGYLNRHKLGNGRLAHTISASPYIGIEPEIERSSLDRYDIIMHVEDSLYS